MRNAILGVLVCVATALTTASGRAVQTQAPRPSKPATPPALVQQSVPQDSDFYSKSLHFTNAGLEYWYSKEHGGLERLTGLPFSSMPCSGCHVKSCDGCHLKNAEGRPSYGVPRGKAGEVCEKCHDVDKEAAKLDVHASRGMVCMDCHTAREVHGDGIPHTSMQEAGAIQTSCIGCHKEACAGNSTHKGKVDCNACHVRDLPSCYNCHVETRIKQGKSVSIPLAGPLFLVNHEGKVTLANLHTFVYRGKGMVTFAPSFPHLVMMQGRACNDCHGTAAATAAGRAGFTPVRWNNDKLDAARGIIPVVEGVKWTFPLLDLVDGKWVPIETPPEMLTNYAGFCSPLTREQLARLEKKQWRALQDSNLRPPGS
jgi:hypothetical protein